MSSNHSNQHSDVLIVGGGMVGLFIAHQLLERGISRNITVLDKEPELGRHSSGRNSGVLHAGLHYKPGSLKPQVCVSGSRRLHAWASERHPITVLKGRRHFSPLVGYRHRCGPRGKRDRSVHSWHLPPSRAQEAGWVALPLLDSLLLPDREFISSTGINLKKVHHAQHDEQFLNGLQAANLSGRTFATTHRAN